VFVVDGYGKTVVLKIHPLMSSPSNGWSAIALAIDSVFNIL
jgi:hypothetical protein